MLAAGNEGSGTAAHCLPKLYRVRYNQNCWKAYMIVLLFIYKFNFYKNKANLCVKSRNFGV